MSAQQNDFFYVGASVINLSILGASVFPTVISPPAGCMGMQLRLLQGGTVQILPNAISGSSVGGATAVVQGFPLVTNELYPSNGIMGPSSFYVATTGSSAKLAANFFFTAGGASLA